MSLGTGKPLSSFANVNIIDSRNYIGPHLDCFPQNRISPYELLPRTDKYFNEINPINQVNPNLIQTACSQRPVWVWDPSW